jgi:hypothetical protein
MTIGEAMVEYDEARRDLDRAEKREIAAAIALELAVAERCGKSRPPWEGEETIEVLYGNRLITVGADVERPAVIVRTLETA